MKTLTEEGCSYTGTLSIQKEYVMLQKLLNA